MGTVVVAGVAGIGSVAAVLVGGTEAVAGAVGVSSAAAGVLVGSAIGVAAGAMSMVICKPQPVREPKAMKHSSNARARFPALGMGHPPSFFLISLLKRTLRLQRPADRVHSLWKCIRRCT